RFGPELGDAPACGRLEPPHVEARIPREPGKERRHDECQGADDARLSIVRATRGDGGNGSLHGEERRRIAHGITRSAARQSTMPSPGAHTTTRAKRRAAGLDPTAEWGTTSVAERRRSSPSGPIMATKLSSVSALSTLTGWTSPHAHACSSAAGSPAGRTLR